MHERPEPNRSDPARQPAARPAADPDDARTLKRLMLIAGAAMAAGLAFLAVCIYIVVRDGG